MSPLPNVAALLAKATKGSEYNSRTGLVRNYSAERKKLAAAAPDLAASLIEAADALRNARDPASSWNIDDKVRTARIQHYVDPVLARLVAFDASLKETTE